MKYTALLICLVFPLLVFAQVPPLPLPMPPSHFGHPMIPFGTYGDRSFDLFPNFSFNPDQLYVNFTAGNYAMGDMKGFQRELQSDFKDFRLKRTMIFPISLQCEAGVDFDRDSITYGAYLNFALTKGKLHYSDYSGEIFTAQNISRIVLGGKVSKRITKGVRAYGKAGVNLSFMELLFTTAIHGADNDTERIGFHSLGLNLEPGVMWEYPFKNIMLNITGGYEFNLQGATRFNDYPKAYLMNQDKDKVLINWSGFRFGLGVGIPLKKFGS